MLKIFFFLFYMCKFIKLYFLIINKVARAFYEHEGFNPNFGSYAKGPVCLEPRKLNRSNQKKRRLNMDKSW